MSFRERVGEFRAGLSPRLREARLSLRAILKRPLSLAGLCIVIFFVALAIFSPVIAPSPVNSLSPYLIPKTFSLFPLPPSFSHPFGTSGPLYYSDVFYGVVWGSRVSQVIAMSVVGIALLVGIIVGSLAGYLGGILDEALMRITDIFFAVPALVLALVFILVLGSSIFTVIIAVAIVWWPSYARLVRGEFLRIKNELYVEAAH